MNVAFRPPFPHNDPIPDNCPRLISTDLIATRHQEGDVGNGSTLMETNGHGGLFFLRLKSLRISYESLMASSSSSKYSRLQVALSQNAQGTAEFSPRSRSRSHTYKLKVLQNLKWR